MPEPTDPRIIDMMRQKAALERPQPENMQQLMEKAVEGDQESIRLITDYLDTRGMDPVQYAMDWLGGIPQKVDAGEVPATVTAGPISSLESPGVLMRSADDVGGLYPGTVQEAANSAMHLTGLRDTPLGAPLGPKVVQAMDEAGYELSPTHARVKSTMSPLITADDIQRIMEALKGLREKEEAERPPTHDAPGTPYRRSE